ncbi:MAG: Na+/H+ antiporter subunit G1, partial [Staphylococcus equorum]|nr:Na+/H+ antiporter subunit G1 [Staphylococcus equorum]
TPASKRTKRNDLKDELKDTKI